MPFGLKKMRSIASSLNPNSTRSFPQSPPETMLRPNAAWMNSAKLMSRGREI